MKNVETLPIKRKTEFLAISVVRLFTSYAKRNDRTLLLPLFQQFNTRFDITGVHSWCQFYKADIRI